MAAEAAPSPPYPRGSHPVGPSPARVPRRRRAGGAGVGRSPPWQHRELSPVAPGAGPGQERAGPGEEPRPQCAVGPMGGEGAALPVPARGRGCSRGSCAHATYERHGADPGGRGMALPLAGGGFRFRLTLPVRGARLSGAARLAGRAAPWRESKVRAGRRGAAGNGGCARPTRGGAGPGRAGLREGGAGSRRGSPSARGRGCAEPRVRLRAAGGVLHGAGHPSYWFDLLSL